MDHDLHEQVAIVTGAGGGLGRVYALALAARGAKVVVNDLGAERDGAGASACPADAVAAEIIAAGGEAVASHHSVAAPGGGVAIVKAALEAFGGVHVVINNAGAAPVAAFHELTIDAFAAALSVHLMGSAAVTHAAWPHLLAQKYGRVVMTGSAAGFWGLPDQSSYCAGKAGVVGLAKGLALEGADHGVLVNVVAPGARTRMTGEVFAGKGGWTWRPELVVPVVLYLAGRTCRHNGAIFSAMAGRFARIEAVQSQGVAFDPRGDVSTEDFVGAVERIWDLADAAPLESAFSPQITGAAKR